ncbi:hypothetical protein M9H77_35179 [Catharanthus roseus]|uniref:Uncharacterized protein n=1 Tax=Catharanthus roseus TaxID=4058 RepID=A0ACB9ZNA9_CATRO|nr:hypothetical protein M9H77_35179 [Catharanthus roseus]
MLNWSCARLVALNQAKKIHIYADKNGFQEALPVNNALIHMYAMCGSLCNRSFWSDGHAVLVEEGLHINAPEVVENTPEAPNVATCLLVKSTASLWMNLLQSSFWKFILIMMGS